MFWEPKDSQSSGAEKRRRGIKLAKYRGARMERFLNVVRRLFCILGKTGSYWRV